MHFTSFFAFTVYINITTGFIKERYPKFLNSSKLNFKRFLLKLHRCSSSYVLSLCEKGKVFSPLFELYEILIYIEEDDIDKANESLNSLETQLKEREVLFCY